MNFWIFSVIFFNCQQSYALIINEPSLTVCGEGAGVGGALAGLGGGGVARVGVAGAVGGVRCVH